MSRVQYESNLKCGCVLTSTYTAEADPSVVGRVLKLVRTAVVLCPVHSQAVAAQEV